MNSPSSQDERDIEVNVVSEPNSPSNEVQKFRSVNSFLNSANSPQKVAQNFSIGNDRKTSSSPPPNSSSIKKDISPGSSFKFKTFQQSEHPGLRSGGSPVYGHSPEYVNEAIKIIQVAGKDRPPLHQIKAISGNKQRESSPPKEKNSPIISATTLKGKDDVKPKLGDGQTSGGHMSFSISSILNKTEPKRQLNHGNIPRPPSPPRNALEAAAFAAHHLHSCSDAAMLSR